jgi:hypothetical protein
MPAEVFFKNAYGAPEPSQHPDDSGAGEPRQSAVPWGKKAMPRGFLAANAWIRRLLLFQLYPSATFSFVALCAILYHKLLLDSTLRDLPRSGRLQDLLVETRKNWLLAGSDEGGTRAIV